MAFARVGLSLLLLVTFCVLQGNGLSCHKCAPGPNTDCTDIKNAPIGVCDLEEASRTLSQLQIQKPQNMANRLVCLKVVSTANGKTGTLRSCFPAIDNVCETFREKVKSAPSASLQSCDICDSDGCNGANSPVIMSYITVSIISIFIAFYNIL